MASVTILPENRATSASGPAPPTRAFSALRVFSARHTQVRPARPIPPRPNAPWWTCGCGQADDAGKRLLWTTSEEEKERKKRTPFLYPSSLTNHTPTTRPFPAPCDTNGSAHFVSCSSCSILAKFQAARRSIGQGTLSPFLQSRSLAPQACDAVAGRGVCAEQLSGGDTHTCTHQASTTQDIRATVPEHLPSCSSSAHTRQTGGVVDDCEQGLGGRHRHRHAGRRRVWLQVCGRL